MLRSISIVSLFCAFFVTGWKPGPRYVPSQGEVWPKPQGENKKIEYFTFSPKFFEFKVINQKCGILSKAISRYYSILQDFYAVLKVQKKYKAKKAGKKKEEEKNFDEKFIRDTRHQGYIHELQLNLKRPCEEYPRLQMDESYSLSISRTSVLTSDSVWGMLRGMETYAQLFYISSDYTEMRVNMTEIFDFPNYFHRGLLVDTSRHYISVHKILKMLDAMAMNKMNVFHWHIVDDQSFPYQSEKYPEFSAKGSFYPTMVYTVGDIQMIINFARDRGIRVVPEFDMPGHSRSWGLAYPDMLTDCYDDAYNKIGTGPLQPLKKSTYKIIRDIVKEAQHLFIDSFFHVGGDDVDFECWTSNPDIQKFMIQKNYTNIEHIYAIFMRKILRYVGKKSHPVVWQEVYDYNVTMPPGSVVQVWKWPWGKEMAKILNDKFRVIFSGAWFLDFLGDGFTKLYSVEPREMVRELVQKEMLDNILGGEACLWGELVDDNNILTRTWPRACAVAEVLWSVTKGFVSPDGYNRIEEHVCRMVRRGIPAEPALGPGFCVSARPAKLAKESYADEDIEVPLIAAKKFLKPDSYDDKNVKVQPSAAATGDKGKSKDDKDESKDDKDEIIDDKDETKDGKDETIDDKDESKDMAKLEKKFALNRLNLYLV